MSVYTRVEPVELAIFLQQYPFGELLGYEGIAAGIENSHYLLSTTQGEFVLTLFEWITDRQLDYFLRLLQHLQLANFPCPQPQSDNQGLIIHSLAEKPAVIFKRISGVSVTHPTGADCQQVGTQLAQLHLHGANFPVRRTNEMDLRWCQQISNKIKPRLKTADYQKIIAELEFQALYSTIKLPQGLIHGDLFKDNVLFENGRLTGVLDFYDACHDNFLTDIAIAANDWCHEPDGKFNRAKLDDFLASYQQIRKLTSTETQLLPVMLRLSALRFWLSRLEHQLFVRAGDLTQAKDPLLYRYLLEQHQAGKA